MYDLIEALQIFAKYKNEDRPVHCEHDVLSVMGVTREEVSSADASRLEELGFVWSDGGDGCWISFRFGSA